MACEKLIVPEHAGFQAFFTDSLWDSSEQIAYIQADEQ
jgi:hypothetical protein